MKLKNRAFLHGFTLTELMIVIAIIGILAALIVMTFNLQLFKGNDAKRKSDLDRIKIAVEEYEKDHNCYPTAISMSTCGTSSEIAVHPYLNNVPCDPITNDVYFYEPEEASCPSWYRLYGVLQNEKDIKATLGIGPNKAYNYIVSSENAPDIIDNAENSGYYGCNNCECKPISYDPTRPGPACDPNYLVSNCGGACVNSTTGSCINNCVSWK